MTSSLALHDRRSVAGLNTSAAFAMPETNPAIVLWSGRCPQVSAMNTMLSRQAASNLRELSIPRA